MAKMIPSVLDIDSPPGEKELYRRLREDPATAEWIVLHSLDIAKHKVQIKGEADFVVIIPGKGVLVLEVKSHDKVWRAENGLWHYGNSDTNIKGPFKQASQAMHSLQDRVVDKRPDFSRIPFWSAVVLPKAKLAAVSQEWHPWQVIDITAFTKPISENLLNVINKAREYLAGCPTAKWFYPESSEPYPDQCLKIADILRPKFDFVIDHKQIMAEKERELLHYTEEQIAALDALQSNKRVIFQGPAGTGKTFLALEAARRSGAEGRKVLLLSFNRLLGEWIRKKTDGMPGVTAKTINQFMLDACKNKAVPKDADEIWWKRTLPKATIDSILETEGLLWSFDEIIADEAQDILRPEYLDVMDWCLKGGLAGGRWRMFGDFERQAIFAGEEKKSLDDFREERFNDAVSYSLQVNCRNTPKVAIYAQLLGGLNPYYKKIRRSDDGADAVIKYYNSRQEQGNLLMGVLGELYKEGYKGEEIVVLSPLAEDCCAASITADPWKGRLKKYQLSGASGYIGYTTIHAFKGLEAPAVIVTDIEQITEPYAKDLLYIGTTRALHRLYILAAEGAKSQVISAVIQNAKA